jgi:hypothetical protein
MKPDEVCAKYADRNVRITSRLIDDSVVFEGDSEALEFPFSLRRMISVAVKSRLSRMVLVARSLLTNRI